MGFWDFCHAHPGITSFAIMLAAGTAVLAILMWGITR